MSVTKLFFVLPALLLLLSCEQPRIETPAFKLPLAEQGLINQLRHASLLIPDSLEDDKKEFLEDSLKNVVDQWLSKKTGLKADRWIGIVTNDTIGQNLGTGYSSILQLDIPVPKTDDITTGAKFDFMRSITLTMSVDEDDQDIYRARKRLQDGDTVVFSGYFTPMSSQISYGSSHPGEFFTSPSLDDFTLTELFKKSVSMPPVRPEPDTAGLAKSPVRASARLKIKRFEDKRFINIKVTLKNTSNKKITKLSVRWLVTNKTGHPAKVNGATGVWQEGYFNQDLDAGGTLTGEWLHESPDGEKVQLIFPKWVSFYNGTKWRIGKH